MDFQCEVAQVSVHARCTHVCDTEYPHLAPPPNTNCSSRSELPLCHLWPLTPDLIPAGGNEGGIPPGEEPTLLCLLLQDTIPLTVMHVLLW